ncbi:Arsenical pump membrane protein, ArsB [Metarhizium album ARSEF 1941]|uniref:Arsenical pump membrane protein, ArsB n=1 Tax=Metarhizium album (strain ARSEF 1941) TaxID=1081103 RepID=A0A0B2WUC8_METAS|nr:Arsenical pump membrane protein, ArsB [Metarhizium album ARSEF 1941]KHN97077.1 Arsenical pump membrane protein, ArsB [Metarhizium album ARSEF 1941]
MDDGISLDTDQIRNWRSIVTLIVFILTNINVLFPFHVPIFVPRRAWNALLDGLSHVRIIAPRNTTLPHHADDDNDEGHIKQYLRFDFPMNLVTAPLLADLFLLAILAIGRKEVHDGTLGADNISPVDIMAFFITLAYIAISIDASGLIRFLAFKILQWGGKLGHRLFFFLYTFFFLLGSFIGNDPIILSGTPFLAYMTKVSSNIVHPRAWIHTQFSVANIASAVLVSSNPTNLVLAGAFEIRFINYTANVIVPVLVTAVVLFPCLVYIVFASEALVPHSITMHELPQEVKEKKPVNPNIPHARGQLNEGENSFCNDEQSKLLSLEQIMNPFLDKGGAAFGAVIMAATLITVLVINAVSAGNEAHPVFWVTLPAAFVMFCWDVGFGWFHRAETRQIARRGQLEVENARIERALRERDQPRSSETDSATDGAHANELQEHPSEAQDVVDAGGRNPTLPSPPAILVSRNADEIAIAASSSSGSVTSSPTPLAEDATKKHTAYDEKTAAYQNAESDPTKCASRTPNLLVSSSNRQGNERGRDANDLPFQKEIGPATLTSLLKDAFRWCRETFPTATAVILHLPFALVPFAFSMFVLVQALVTKGWIPVFAYGWDQWVKKTGTVGAIGGMGFLSVLLCNFAGTNIGTTILLSRVIQTWQKINIESQTDISDRTFWATVYSMAIGVNYGAFSTAFSASLAGLLWRDILSRKHIHVQGLEFARVNLPIIAITMAVGCTVLTGQVYIVRSDKPYNK